MSELVRHSSSIPVASDFASPLGAPIIINDVTGIVYVITSAGVVTALQTALGSGTTLKTVNGSSLLGSGDLVVGDPPMGSYAPGSFTVITGKFAILLNRLLLTTTQRLTMEGTARLSLEGSF